ncbi:MAG TPA: isocitrate lyase/PEP mutase family protein [Thermoanaerobaculia bacterium]|jgi:2-methylisocitrate lyase-like PEP mutase family enzyme
MSDKFLSHGRRLRDELARRPTLPFIGVYDAYSASLAVRQFDTLFLSGFSFSASYYGLPDEGFIAWPDIVACAQRIRAVAPAAHLLVDMDDGYGDPGVATHAAAMLESVGASAIVLEDQLRPKKCGHLDDKQVMDLDGYVQKLERVLAVRRDLVVIARTDAADPDERLRRARAFDRTAADAILVDGIADLEFLRQMRREVRKPLAFNQIAGGKSPARSWTELREAGVSIIIYSTPCLFAAHQAIEQELVMLRNEDGRLPEPVPPRVSLALANARLRENLDARSTGLS